MSSSSVQRYQKRPRLQFRLATLFLMLALVCVLVKIFGRAIIEYGFAGAAFLFFLFAILILPFLWLCWRELMRSTSKSSPRETQQLPDEIDVEAIESLPSSERRSKPRRERIVEEPPWFQPPGIGPRGYR